MIAYDFDGVLVPDIDHIDCDQDVFEQVFLGIRPIFVPTTPWVIVTGRTDGVLLRRWLDKHLPNTPPQNVFINHQDLLPHHHKSAVLRLLDYDIFVESDPEQTRLIREAGHRVVHFGDYCKKSGILSTKKA